MTAYREKRAIWPLALDWAGGTFNGSPSGVKWGLQTHCSHLHYQTWTHFIRQMYSVENISFKTFNSLVTLFYTCKQSFMISLVSESIITHLLNRLRHCLIHDLHTYIAEVIFLFEFTYILVKFDARTRENNTSFQFPSNISMAVNIKCVIVRRKIRAPSRRVNEVCTRDTLFKNLY